VSREKKSSREERWTEVEIIWRMESERCLGSALRRGFEITTGGCSRMRDRKGGDWSSRLAPRTGPAASRCALPAFGGRGSGVGMIVRREAAHRGVMLWSDAGQDRQVRWTGKGKGMRAGARIDMRPHGRATELYSPGERYVAVASWMEEVDSDRCRWSMYASGGKPGVAAHGGCRGEVDAVLPFS
jgi:hypothetical protein